MKKIKYYKDEKDNLYRFSNNITEGYVNKRWFKEDSLMEKIINNKFTEIDEKEAREMLNIKRGRKAIFSVSLLIPYVIIIIFLIALYFLLSNYFSGRTTDEEMEYERQYSNFVSKVSIGKDEKEIDKYSEDLIKLVPFYSLNEKNAYTSSIDVYNIDKISNATLTYMGIVNYSNYLNASNYNGESYSRMYLLNNITTSISSVYAMNITPDVLHNYVIDGLNCVYIEGNNSFGCNKVLEPYDTKVSKILKVTEEDNNLYYYEGVLFVKDYVENDNNTADYSLYKYGDVSKLIGTKSNDVLLDGIAKKYLDEMTIYKHTYIKNDFNAYQWVSTELNK